MEHADAAAALEAVLETENAALEQNDTATVVALIAQKLAATQSLSANAVSPERLHRLRVLATDNRRLLERAIHVQSEIINMVARAAQAAPTDARYGADCRTVRNDGALAIARQA